MCKNFHEVKDFPGSKWRHSAPKSEDRTETSVKLFSQTIMLIILLQFYELLTNFCHHNRV